MNASPNKVERRRHRDDEPRATYAKCPVLGQCDLVRVGSLEYDFKIFAGFEVLDVTDGAALMRAPPGWLPPESAS